MATQSKYNFSIISFWGIILCLVISVTASLWFDLTYQKEKLPTIQTNTPEPTIFFLDPTSNNITPKANLTPTPQVTPNPQPNLASPLPLRPTNTPVPQNVQLKASFIAGALICLDNNVPIVTSIISQTETLLQETENLYKTCTLNADNQTTACVAKCVEISCLLTCEQLAANTHGACDSPYHQIKDPIVLDATTNLLKYCVLLN